MKLKFNPLPLGDGLNFFLLCVGFRRGTCGSAFLVVFFEDYDIIHFLRREMLDFTAFPVFFVSNLLLVQRKKYYFNRAMVSRNCSIVL